MSKTDPDLKTSVLSEFVSNSSTTHRRLLNLVEGSMNGMGREVFLAEFPLFLRHPVSSQNYASEGKVTLWSRMEGGAGHYRKR